MLWNKKNKKQENVGKKKSFGGECWRACFVCALFSKHVAACTLLAIYNVALSGMHAHANKKRLLKERKAGLEIRGISAVRADASCLC